MIRDSQTLDGTGGEAHGTHNGPIPSFNHLKECPERTLESGTVLNFLTNAHT